MNPFTLVDGEPYPLDMRGELDDTAAFKNFKKYVGKTLTYTSTSIFSSFASRIYMPISSQILLFSGGVT